MFLKNGSCESRRNEKHRKNFRKSLPFRKKFFSRGVTALLLIMCDNFGHLGGTLRVATENQIFLVKLGYDRIEIHTL